MVNIETYYVSLDDANANAPARYVKEYDMLSAYNLQPPLNIDQWLALATKVEHDPTYAALYAKYTTVSYSAQQKH